MVNVTTGEEENDKTNADERIEERNTEDTNENSKVEKTREKEIVERNRDFLEERMDPDSGLLDALLAKGILSRKEMAEVKDKSPIYTRNSKLLMYMLEENQCSDLIAALRDNEQKHIVNYLYSNGGN